MDTKNTLDIILGLITEETKRIKKKKKKSKVSAPVLTRPMGSIFYMDAAVSLNENAEKYAGKPIPSKFNHLKWPLNNFQKQFLDDFISIPEESLKEADYKYASSKTGIPLENIRSIKNTLGETGASKVSDDELRERHKGIVGSMLDTVNQQFTDVRDLSKNNSGKFFPINNEPEFRGVSPREMMYNKNMKDMLHIEIERGIDCKDGVLDRGGRVQIPEYMFEWLMYFLEGSETVKIKNSQILDERFSKKYVKPKYVMFSIETPIQETKLASYDLMSNKNLKDLEKFESKVKEFNETFKTNFEIEFQYTGDDGFLTVVLENMQYFKDGQIKNHKRIDMTQTDEYREIIFNLRKSFDEQ